MVEKWVRYAMPGGETDVYSLSEDDSLLRPRPAEYSYPSPAEGMADLAMVMTPDLDNRNCQGGRGRDIIVIIIIIILGDKEKG